MFFLRANCCQIEGTIGTSRKFRVLARNCCRPLDLFTPDSCVQDRPSGARTLSPTPPRGFAAMRGRPLHDTPRGPSATVPARRGPKGRAGTGRTQVTVSQRRAQAGEGGRARRHSPPPSAKARRQPTPRDAVHLCSAVLSCCGCGFPIQFRNWGLGSAVVPAGDC
jgi:hypothetical protein